jgi:hypothetical protein
MPATTRPSKSQLARLRRLPRLPDLVLEGGKRPLAVPLRLGDQQALVQTCLWVDAASGMVRASQALNPQSQDGGTGEALHALAAACAEPFADGPDGDAQALLGAQVPAVRRRAREGSPQPPPPGLPARVLVNDRELAEAARAFLAPFRVPVEYAEHLPALEAAFQSLDAFMVEHADELGESAKPFAWEIDQTMLPPLFKAAAGYWRRAPWEYLPDDPPLSVALGEHGLGPEVPTLYASVMGAAGLLIGVVFYFSLETFQRVAHERPLAQVNEADIDTMIGMLRQVGAPLDAVPPEMLRELVGGVIAQAAPGQDGKEVATDDSLLVFFDERDECPPSYLAWLQERGLTYPSRQGVPSFFRTFAQGGEPRPPDGGEVRVLTLAIEALNQFFSHRGSFLRGPFVPPDGISYRAQVQVGGDSGRTEVAVRYPPEGYVWEEDGEGEGDEEWEEEEDEEADRPASRAGARTLYRFQVKLDQDKTVWRRIELRGDQTLHHLHSAIQRAFDWDDDHLYAFFLSGRPWDEDTSFESPEGDGRDASRYRLEHIPLRQGQRFLYIFDFGDEWRHNIKLEAILPDGVQPRTQYPRITDRHGESVPQYPREDVEGEGEDEL